MLCYVMLCYVYLVSPVYNIALLLKLMLRHYTTFAITSDPLYLLPLSAVSALPNAMILACIVLGQPWPTPGPLLRLVSHSGIKYLHLFARLFYLLPFPLVS